MVYQLTAAKKVHFLSTIFYINWKRKLCKRNSLMFKWPLECMNNLETGNEYDFSNVKVLFMPFKYLINTNQGDCRIANEWNCILFCLLFKVLILLENNILDWNQNSRNCWDSSHWDSEIWGKQISININRIDKGPHEI